MPSIRALLPLVLTCLATISFALDRDASPVALLPLPANSFDSVAATGVALAAGLGGGWYSLSDNPPSIAYWTPEGSAIARTGESPEQSRNVTDLCAYSGAQVLLVSPTQPQLVRYNQRLQPLPDMTPDPLGARLEPLSAASLPGSDLFLINRADGDLWRVDGQMRARPLLQTRANGGLLVRPTRIRPIDEAGRIVVLDDPYLFLYDPSRDRMTPIPSPVSAPQGLGVRGNQMWVVGDGLACVDLSGPQVVFSLSADSLASIGVTAPADVLPISDDRLIILLKPSSLAKAFQIIYSR